jgi:protein-tyrosine phosphatase
MIDTHCHLLARLDDGPTSRSESIRMARKLTERGVTHVVCTPHFSRRHPTDQHRAAGELVRLERALVELEIPLQLMLAAEVGPIMALEAPLAELQRRAIGRRFVLVELVRETTSKLVELILDRLLTDDLLPIFAHPERCRAVQSEPGTLIEAKERGALLQVVAPSLVGDAPAAVGRTAWGLVLDGAADIVASDAHRADSSRVRLDALSEVVAQRAGVSTAERLFLNGPRDLLEAAGLTVTV